MQDKTVRRRDFLKAAVGTTIATALRPQRPADFVFRNGKIITLDRNSTIADSIAIAGDRIAAVGPNAAMAAFTAPATRTIDLRGKTITDNVPISLFWPIWESVARLSRVTNERIAPEQAITRAQALRCATENGAYLTFDEDKKGSLEPGKLADLAVLSADPLTVPEPAIRDITADMTMVGGKIVHQIPN